MLFLFFSEKLLSWNHTNKVYTTGNSFVPKVAEGEQKLASVLHR